MSPLWRPEEDAQLRALFGTKTSTEIAKLLGRSTKGVLCRAQKLDLGAHARGKRPGTRSLADRIMIAATAAGAAGITESSVRAMMAGLASQTYKTTISRLRTTGKLFTIRTRYADRFFVSDAYAKAWAASQPAKPRGKKPHWTTAEDARIRQLFPSHGAAHVAQLLGRSDGGVAARAKRLGLKCSSPVSAVPAPVRIIKSGPFKADALVTLHPNFKFTRAPTPPVSLRSNTYPVF